MTIQNEPQRASRLTALTRRVRGRVLAGLVALLAAGAAAVAVVVSSGTSLPRLTPAQSHYLRLAEQGVAKTSRWWNKKLDWYDSVLSDHSRLPLAHLWDTNGLFEALDEIALARPTAHNLAALTAFATGSERYWNPDLRPVPGYAPYVDDRSVKQQTWFDDNGWIGLAFLDAYRATRTRRYLTDAERAFSFIAAEGWDTPAGGGMWWSTSHPWRSGEALAAAADLAARLYQATGRKLYETAAEKYIGWADRHLLQVHGVYINTANTPYPYLIEPKVKSPSTPTASGSPSPSSGAAELNGTQHRTPAGNRVFRGGSKTLLTCPKGARNCKPGMAVTIDAHGPFRAANAKPTMVAMPHDGEGAMLAAVTTMCETTGEQSWCRAAEKLAGAMIVWLAPYSDGPQYDSVLVRGLLTLYAHDHNPRWYRFAVAISRLISAHAQTSPGLYLRGWDGRAVPGAQPGMLRTDAGSIDVFSDLATVAPPG